MRRSLAALALTVTAVAGLSGCGDSGTPETPKNTAGLNPAGNTATATLFFDAVASNDPVKVEAAYTLAAPKSRALSYLQLVRSGLTAAGTPDTVTEDNGRYTLCRAAQPTSCRTFAAIVLADGKVNDFTVDGKRIQIR